MTVEAARHAAGAVQPTLLITSSAQRQIASVADASVHFPPSVGGGRRRGVDSPINRYSYIYLVDSAGCSAVSSESYDE